MMTTTSLATGPRADLTPLRVLGLMDVHWSGRDPLRLPDLAEVDLVLLGGDITHFKGIDVARALVEEIQKAGPRVLAVCGNCDRPEVESYLEETGITPDKAEIIRESSDWLPYDLPRHLVPKLWKGRYRGQKQRWFALRFLGADTDVKLDAHKPEFSVWSWMAHDELIRRIVPFKRDTYARVFAEFGDLL